MNRRDALRAVTAVAAGTVAAGCDASPIVPAAHPAAPATSAGPAPLTSARAAAPKLPHEISHGPRDRMNVALTFHGQGEPATVGRLLDEIAHGGARVTVLAVGSWLAAQPALAHRILDAGHELGNHTQHHVDIKRMSAAQAVAEIDACAKALRTISGSIGRWFRPSQTRHATATIKAAARKVGYPTCLSYDVDSLDYTDPGAAAVADTILNAVRPGSIVSLHFGHAGTVTAMAPLLKGLHERGLTPVTMTELLT
jgi:peptidoglycan/xylan/chitin deacetylase (PgdA/CDA1 family)